MSEAFAQGLDRHLQLAEQIQIGFGGASQRGEVVADDDGVDAAEDALLGTQVAEGDLPSAGESQDGAGQREPERRPERHPVFANR